jgi:hypothetical protein
MTVNSRDRSEISKFSAWPTSRPPATAARLPAPAHASADIRTRRFLAAQIPAVAARDRVAGSAVARVVGGCPLPPLMAMFAHCHQTLVLVIHPVTTISHPILPKGGCQNTGAGTHHWSGQRTPRRPVSLEGPRASYHAKRRSASSFAQVFLTFGGASVTVKTTRQETLHVSHFLLCATLHFRYARLDLLASS